MRKNKKFNVKQLFVNELPRLKQRLESAKSRFQVCSRKFGTLKTMPELMAHLSIYYKLQEEYHNADLDYYQAYNLVINALDSIEGICWVSH